MVLMRKVVHIDLDCYFAAIEQRDQPELKGLPIAVGHEGERGVVMTASYEARKYGVRSAMPSRTAKERCPQLVFVRARMDVYREVSRQIREAFYAFTDLVEPLSLDEAYLDVTAPKQGPCSGTLIAKLIKQEILKRTGLTASAGVSYNKFLAKIASGMNKPDGLTVIKPEEAEGFVETLPVGAFFGVGPRTAARMHALGITTGADLKKQSLEHLTYHFGKHGAHYYSIARAIDERPVNPDRERKSLGAETTFRHDSRDKGELNQALLPLCETVSRRLTQSQLEARVVVVKVKFSDFHVITRRTTLPLPIHDATAIHQEAVRLLENVVLVRAVRLIGVTVQGLSDIKEQRVVQPMLPF